MPRIRLDQIVSKIGGDVDQFSRAVTIALFNGVIRDTRVDTGRLRGNWQTTVGKPAQSEVERIDKIEQGQAGGAAEEEVAATVKPASLNVLTNNLPYAEVWEERDGMVAKNVARMGRNVREQARKS